MVCGLTVGYVCVLGDGESAAQTGHCARIDVNVARHCLFNGSDGLMHFAVAKTGRELDRTRFDYRGWFSCEHIRERRRSTCVEIVSGPHEEIRIAFERAGLRECGLKRCVRRASKIHPISEAQHGPVTLACAPGNAGTRPPLPTQARHFLRQRQIDIVEQREWRWACSNSQRIASEATIVFFGCHCDVTKPAQSLVLSHQFAGPMVCEYEE